MLNRSWMSARVPRIGMLSLCLAMFSIGCAGTPGDLDTRPPQHASTTARIKAALIRDPDVDAAAVRVSIRDGQLMLDGFVSTPEEKRSVVDIAGEHSKDFDIVDRIEVR